MIILILLSSIEYEWILSLHNKRVALLLKRGGGWTHKKEGTLQNPENPNTLERGVGGGKYTFTFNLTDYYLISIHCFLTSPNKSGGGGGGTHFEFKCKTNLCCAKKWGGGGLVFE